MAGPPSIKHLESVARKYKSKVRHLESELSENHGEDDGEGNWLVSYADLMTLLFGFFVIISAFSTPDAAKMEQVKKETSESMGGTYKPPHLDLSSSILETLKDLQLEKDVNIIDTAEGVTIVAKGTLFFDSASSVLKPRAQEMMEKIAGTVAEKAKGFRVLVEGHTDSSPINTKEFPSNWELSSSRAGAVVRLMEERGHPRPDLRAIGMADTEPVVPERTEEGVYLPEKQAENRRIVVKIQKQLPKRMKN